MSNFFTQIVSSFTPQQKPAQSGRRTNRTKKQAQKVRAATLKDTKRTAQPKKAASPAASDSMSPREKVEIQRRQRRTKPSREQAAAQNKKFWSDVSSGISTVGEAGGNLIQGVVDFAGKGLTFQSKVAADVQSTVLKTGSDIGGSALEAVGMERAGARLRKTGDSAAKLIQENKRTGTKLVEDFVSGVGDGAGDVVSSVADAIADPVTTAKGLGNLAYNVTSVGDVVDLAKGKSLQEIAERRQNFVKGIVEGFKGEYAETDADHGKAGMAGRLVFDVASTVLSGGSTGAARGGLKATKLGIRSSLNGLDDMARASRAVSRGEQVVNVRRGSGLASDPALMSVRDKKALGIETKPQPRIDGDGRVVRNADGTAKTYTPQEVSRAPGAVGQFLGNQMRAGGVLKPAAERITKLAESASDFAARRQSSRTARALEKGEEKLKKGLGAGQEGVELLGPTRASIDGLRDTFTALDKNWGKWDSAQVDEAIRSLPETQRNAIRDMRARGLNDEAMEAAKLGLARNAVSDSLATAGKLDELYPFELPKNVDSSNVAARGRRESLEFLLDSSDVSSDALRRNARHILGDSDVTGPVFIQKFSKGDKVGRAFSASAGRQTGATGGSFIKGGYFGEAGDALRSRSQIQRRNAVSLDNHADKFALFEIPEETFAVASRVGEQYKKYGAQAEGGGLQYTFAGKVEPKLDNVSDVGRLSKAQSDLQDRAVSLLDFEEMRQDSDEVAKGGAPSWMEVLGLE